MCADNLFTAETQRNAEITQRKSTKARNDGLCAFWCLWLKTPGYELIRRSLRLGSLLLHVLTHRRNMSGGAFVRPCFKLLRSLFQVREEVGILKTFPELRHHRLELFPHSEELATGLKEKILVEKAVIEQRARLLPITNHHSHEGSVFSSGGSDFHRFFHRFGVVTLLKPIARLPQSRLTAQIVNFQV